MVQQGKVLSVEGELATVEIIRESACSSCHNKDSCGAGAVAGCAKSERVQVKALNTARAVAGQTVMLTSDSKKTIGIAFCVFVLPIILAFAAYFICMALGALQTSAAVIAVVVFFIALFGFFFGLDRLLSKRINVEITDVIE